MKYTKRQDQFLDFLIEKFGKESVISRKQLVESTDAEYPRIMKHQWFAKSKRWNVGWGKFIISKNPQKAIDNYRKNLLSYEVKQDPIKLLKELYDE